MDAYDDTLEEGRVALHMLERQLKERGPVQVQDLGENGSVGSKQQSLNSERRLLDQVPRDARLNYRKGSPLGLTVEELDDRGLLDGGSSVPSYYTSLKQRSRRPLEMKKRSSRLQERGQETASKMMKGFFHVIRALVRRGLKIEEYCAQMDNEGRGMIDKVQFSLMLRNMGLPFGPRELAEIVLRYTVPSSEKVDYESFLRDANVLGEKYERRMASEGEISLESVERSDVGIYSNVIIDVKRMLMESVQSLGKNIDDVYRMFARWDFDGTGTVTATQFLRVLAHLHIDLSDQDQDFLVEILDSNEIGRVDFESLLNFCFAENESEELIGTPVTGSIRSSVFGEDGEVFLPPLSSEKKIKSKEQILGGDSGNSVNSLSRRPHTASSYRVEEEQPRRGIQRANTDVGKNSDGTRDSAGVYNNSMNNNNISKRPLTAQARVTQRSSPKDSNQYNSSNRPSQSEKQNLLDDERHLIVNELGDDVIDDDNYNDFLRNRPNESRLQQQFNRDLYPDGYYQGSYNGSVNSDPGGNDGAASFNDNTLITDQDELFFGSPQGLPTNGDRDLWNNNSIDDGYSQNNNENLQSGNIHYQRQGDQNINNQQQKIEPQQIQHREIHHHHHHQQQQQQQQQLYHLQQNYNSEPYEHLLLLATQTLKTLKEIIIKTYRTGKSLEAIFQHFDRKGNMYFDAKDFMKATSDLRIETSPRVADIAISMISIDSIDQVVSFGEFKVFVTDGNHKEFQYNIQQIFSEEFSQQGRKYQELLYNVFWEQESALHLGRSSEKQSILDVQNGFVSITAFREGFKKIGSPKLGSSDLDRLIARFDVHSQGKIAVPRFLGMIQNCESWKKAERVISLQENATEEALILRNQLKDRSSRNDVISQDLIRMAEYLGIGVISEEYLLWIAADALKAPLPMSWTVQKDSKGRTFFYNHINNESRWDHPLDPHFRKLRDKYRQIEQEKGNIDNSRQTISNFIVNPPLPSHHIYGGITAPASPTQLSNVLRPTVPSLSSIDNSMQKRLPATVSNNTMTSDTPSLFQQQPQSRTTRPVSSNPSARTRRDQLPESVKEEKRRSRPQSAVAEKTPFPETDNKITWRNRQAPAIQEVRTLFNLNHVPSNNSNNNSNYVVPTSQLDIIETNQKQISPKYTIEQIYNSSYFNKDQSNKGGSNSAKILPQSQQRAINSNDRTHSSNNISNNRPNSANKQVRASSAGRRRAGSAVDRALNYGKDLQPSSRSNAVEKEKNYNISTPYQQGESARNEKLSGMYDDNLVGRLDSIIMTKKELVPQQSPQVKMQQMNIGGKGGIVLI